MSDCIFCKIIRKELSSKIVYEDEEIIAFKDLNSVAPTHLLFIPKKHIESLDAITEEDISLLGKLQYKISEYAREHGLARDGYRVVNNMGRNGGQTVFHLHFHLMAQRNFHWPPG